MSRLEGKTDVYGGILLDSSHFRNITADSARAVLETSIQSWRKDDVRGIWFHVDIQDSWWVPILTEHGFQFHHAQPTHVMLTKWIPTSRPSSLPLYPFTSIGVGGIVVNEKGEILLMKEQRGIYLGWKFPGGSGDPGEEIYETATREVLEETGVETEFVCLLTFRHSLTYRYPKTADIYFLCVLKPKDEGNITPKPCQHETADCRWFSREEINKLPNEEFHEFHRFIIDRYDKWKESGRNGIQFQSFEIPQMKRRFG
uniref:Nudix hydrolase domain-containing protein n=1 Tax=Acrobeloides nanus TaxID=290746 RepID=A0A914C0N2_9BILA